LARKRVTAATIVRLVLASLAVGVVLAVLGVTPVDLLEGALGLVRGAWEAASRVLGWAGSYVLLGALVVLPLWLLAYLWGRLKGD